MPTLTIAVNEHTRSLGIAGMQAVIESEIATHTYSVLVVDMDGLTAEDLEVEAEENNEQRT